MLPSMAGEKKQKRDQLSVYVDGPLRALILKFREEYPYFTDSQIAGRARSHYIEEVLAHGMDPKTLLPQVLQAPHEPLQSA